MVTVEVLRDSHLHMALYIPSPDITVENNLQSVFSEASLVINTHYLRPDGKDTLEQGIYNLGEKIPESLHPVLFLTPEGIMGSLEEEDMIYKVGWANFFPAGEPASGLVLIGILYTLESCGLSAGE